MHPKLQERNCETLASGDTGHTSWDMLSLCGGDLYVYTHSNIRLAVAVLGTITSCNARL